MITLGQLIKLLNLVESGADVKAFLGTTSVLVNGEPENRRGRKLFIGDKVDVPSVGKVQITGDEQSYPRD